MLITFCSVFVITERETEQRIVRLLLKKKRSFFFIFLES